MDADVTADLKFNEFRRITQQKLNYLIRDLDLPKSKAELFMSAAVEPSGRKCLKFCVS
jgi:hypothetical protein